MNTCEITLPKVETTLEQNEEWIWINNGDKRRRILLHDYGAIYNIPGLYESIFCDTLKTRSPEVISSMLSHELNKFAGEVDGLRVLDFGAGNGMVGEVLRRQTNCELIVGIDILLEAEKAAERDRPGVYDEYYAIDMSQLEPSDREYLKSHGFNCLITVAALGFGDIPTRAFVKAFNLIENQGWIAFNIKDKFLANEDDTGFARLIRRMLNNDILHICSEHKYRHRFSINGEKIYYIAIVGRKKHDINPDDLT